MADIQSRRGPYSDNYSGLINQTILAVCIGSFCVISFELLRRKRRRFHGKPAPRGLEGPGSVESWEFGYLYQGRCWAKNPSPPHRFWPLAWIKQAVSFKERDLLGLVGLDSTLYSRWLRGIAWFTLLHSFTTLPILLPIHVVFSPDEISEKSMTRASLSSLVLSPSGKHLLYVHLILMIWISMTWILTLLWILRGAIRYRAIIMKRSIADKDAEFELPASYHQTELETDEEKEKRALRYRTVMISNLPLHLRTDKDIRGYFEYYSSRDFLRIPSSITPGFASQFIAFLFNRSVQVASSKQKDAEQVEEKPAVVVQKVTLVRKMTELANLIQRREDFLRRLEDAHIKLAKKTLSAVKARMLRQQRGHSLSRATTRGTTLVHDAGRDTAPHSGNVEDATKMEHLIDVLGPFIYEFDPPIPSVTRSAWARFKSWFSWSKSNEHLVLPSQRATPTRRDAHSPHTTVWDALHSLPRDHLDRYQPLIRLNSLFRGATVPEIDYLTAKLQLLTSLINEKRSARLDTFQPVSTAFVTFRTAQDARRVLKDLPTHPMNPLICVVSPAPDYEEIDWIRLMKSTLTGEFLKDWVVSLGVWGFTLFWVIPVSFFVTLVNIDSLSRYIPALSDYLKTHATQRELISSTLPTILVSLLALLIPLLLLLIAKQAQTLVTLTKLHDILLTRYYKFLVCNVLIFFCVGVSALESFLSSFQKALNPLPVIAASFPVAAPFFVGWLIFQTSMQSLLQLALFGLPLLAYPATVRAATTPRKRLAGTRPRTFDYFYWLPNHMTVVVIVMTFAVMNPLVIPFSAIYFMVANVVFKNQFLHVYSKKYDGNGAYLMIRMIRYSLDGLIIAQACLMGLFAVSDKEGLVGGLAALMVVVLGIKLALTRICRARFKTLENAEADALCGVSTDLEVDGDGNIIQNNASAGSQAAEHASEAPGARPPLFKSESMRLWTWRVPAEGMNFGYSSVPGKPGHQGTQATRRQPIPFGPTPHSSKPDLRIGSPHPYRSGGQDELDDPYPISHPLGREGIDARLPPPSDTSLQSPNLHSILVQDHPPRRPWDDRPQIDRTYINPFYGKPIENSLWLPRNPCDIINLDDTVDMFQSITTDPAVGRLAEWNGENLLLPGLTLFESPEEEHSSYINPEELSPVDQAHIELPPDIASRIGDGAEVEQPELRPGLYQRKSSVMSLGAHRQSSINGSARSTSGALPRRTSRISTISQARSGSGTVVPQRQSSLQVPTLNTGGNSLGRPRANTRSSLGIRDAVVNEVVAEENIVQEDQQRQEEDEERQATAPKSFWTSWLYSLKPASTSTD